MLTKNEMEMFEKFDKIFWEVANELNITKWYKLFDSSNFDIVENKISQKFGNQILDTEIYNKWVNEMNMDL